MAECALCGSKNANRKTEIDGVVLDVCNNCVKFGKEIAIVRKGNISRNINRSFEIEDVVEDLPQIIRKQREKMGLKQEELAQKIGIKHNLIKRIEEGWYPDNSIIEKLEKFFKIKLKRSIEE
ncbi:MAG: TIGR00270 family protein [Candidatus Aenigmarchaeota archaeon]|nr:TIGR00270 family protein [Candidatus Aenigmarchaeota archaeon]